MGALHSYLIGMAFRISEGFNSANEISENRPLMGPQMNMQMSMQMTSSRRLFFLFFFVGGKGRVPPIRLLAPPPFLHLTTHRLPPTTHRPALTFHRKNRSDGSLNQTVGSCCQY